METRNTPSRFLREIPPELLHEVRPRVSLTRPVTAPGGFAAGVARRGEPVPGGLRLGQSARHPTFGEGVVIDFEGQGSSARVSVNFRSAGAKWLVLSYARLEPLGERSDGRQCPGTPVLVDCDEHEVPSVTLWTVGAAPVAVVSRDHTSTCTWIELWPTAITCV